MNPRYHPVRALPPLLVLIASCFPKSDPGPTGPSVVLDTMQYRKVFILIDGLRVRDRVVRGAPSEQVVAYEYSAYSTLPSGYDIRDSAGISIDYTDFMSGAKRDRSISIVHGTDPAVLSSITIGQTQTETVNAGDPPLPTTIITRDRVVLRSVPYTLLPAGDLEVSLNREQIQAALRELYRSVERTSARDTTVSEARGMESIDTDATCIIRLQP